MIMVRNQKKTKLRRSTTDAIEFLTEKSEKERELKKEELAIKKRELDLAETRQEEAAQQQQTMFSALMNQMFKFKFSLFAFLVNDSNFLGGNVWRGDL